MLVLLYGGGLVSNSDCAPSLEHASQRALVTEEWSSPDHKLSGFPIKEFASMCGGDSSNGDADVETTWIGEGESGLMAAVDDP
ncbi:hypothetical protein B296_00021374 [Ensete ventricosum]|uniref:Uncharacterized protein n=1 Tax=Ensete ventricosum TaxID=4639 RepID=A0A426ZCN8_ENSVE|nr:hypothetical protein B296_00021374 [Ensete ventricosum]